MSLFTRKTSTSADEFGTQLRHDSNYFNKVKKAADRAIVKGKRNGNPIDIDMLVKGVRRLGYDLKASEIWDEFEGAMQFYQALFGES